MEVIESQVLEAASEVPSPRLGISREASPSHVHLLHWALQLIRAYTEDDQVSVPVIPAPRERLSRTVWCLGPDLALTQEHSQNSC